MSLFKRVGEGLRKIPEDVLRHLGIQYTKHGRIAHIGDLYGGAGKSTQIELDGDKIGLCKDFSTGEGTDMLGLWKNVRGLSLYEAMEQAREWLGIEDLDKRFDKRQYQQFQPESAKQLAALDPNYLDVVSSWLISRGIDRETIRRFDVQAREYSGEWVAVFPHKSPTGELVNCSYRSVINKKIWQEKGCAPTLFGWHTLTSEEIDQGAVVLCEGHIDALTWRMAGWPVLSIPSGSAMTWIEHDWDFLEVFTHIYISMDSDAAGREHMEKIVNRLGRWRCFQVTLPKKDANDVRQSMEDWAEVLGKSIGTAQLMQPKKVVELSECEAEINDILNPVQGLDVFQHRDLIGRWDTKEGFVFLPGDVTVWTGYPGHGKSTVISWLMSLEVKAGRAVFVGSFEQASGITGATFLKQYRGQDRLSIEEVSTSLQAVKHRFYLFREVGGSDAWEVLEAMKYCFHRFGCTEFVIDNLMLLKAERMDDAFKWQLDWLQAVIDFANECKVHVHLVAHPKKTDEDNAPRMYDILGASQIPGLVDNVAAVYRVTPKKSDGPKKVEIYSRKQRNGGWVGRVSLFFDRGTQTFSKVDSADVVS